MNRNILFIITPLLIGGAFLYFSSIDTTEQRESKRVSTTLESTSNEAERSKETHQDKKIENPTRQSSLKERTNHTNQEKREKREFLKKEVIQSDSNSEEDEKSTLLNETTQEIRTELNSRVLSEMQNVPRCLESAKTKEEAFNCSNNLRHMQRELSLLRGDSEVLEIKAYDKDFVWNDESKRVMIQGLKESLTEMQQTNYCMEKIKDPKELAECLEIKD